MLETLVNANEVSLPGYMQDQINLCQYTMAEGSEQRDEEIEATDKEHQLDLHNLREMIQKRTAQKIRIENLQRALAAL